MPDNKLYHVEACITNAEEARGAEMRGADRIELCSRLETEGMTPDRVVVQAVLQAVHIPVRVMLRETESGFEADEIVFEKMKSAIAGLHDLPIDGFVLGVMKDNRIDRVMMKQLIEACKPHHITFHKAIDASLALADDIAWLNTCPAVDTILTSGSEVRASDGVDQIRYMKGLFQGHVMGAGKIVAVDLPGLHAKLGLNWYHGRAIV